jgi:hypothetical protein
MEMRLPKHRVTVITITVTKDGSVFRVHESGAEIVHTRSDHTSARILASTMFLEAGGQGHAVIRDYAKHMAPDGVSYFMGDMFIAPTSKAKDDAEFMKLVMSMGKVIRFPDGAIIIQPTGPGGGNGSH